MGIPEEMALSIPKTLVCRPEMVLELTIATASASAWAEQQERLKITYRAYDQAQLYTPQQEKQHFISHFVVRDSESLRVGVLRYDNILSRMGVRGTWPCSEFWEKLPSRWIRRLRTDHQISSKEIYKMEWPALMSPLLKSCQEVQMEEEHDRKVSGMVNLFEPEGLRVKNPDLLVGQPPIIPGMAGQFHYPNPGFQQPALPFGQQPVVGLFPQARPPPPPVQPAAPTPSPVIRPRHEPAQPSNNNAVVIGKKELDELLELMKDINDNLARIDQNHYNARD